MFFNKKKKEVAEINQMGNSTIKANICDVAADVLVQTNKLTQEDFATLKVEFGYLFTKADGELEGLIKVMSERTTAYCALQNGKFMVVEINEAFYQDTISKMREMHPCLKENVLNETEKMAKRRERNNKYLSGLGITINPNLTGYRDEYMRLKDIDEVCKRAIACLITIQISCDIRKDNYEESLKYFVPLLEKYGVRDSLNSMEKRIVDGTYTKQDIIDMDWAYESFWALCWCLGLVQDIRNGGELCDCGKAIRFVMDSATFNDFRRKCKLRCIEEILDMQDLYYRYNWAINNKKVDDSTNLGNLNVSNVIERRRGLEWIISDEDDWYDLSMPA